MAEKQSEKFYKKIGRYIYNIKKLLGAGSFGQVYLGYDRLTNQ